MNVHHVVAFLQQRLGMFKAGRGARSAAPRFLVSSIVVCLVTFGPVAAKGDTVSVPLRVVELAELWRIPGVIDGESIGKITSVVTDDSGHVFVLDVKKSKISVLRGNDGSLVRSFGRPGEGPGDINRGNTVFLTPKGQLGVVESMPGAIQFFTTTGASQSKIHVPLTEGLIFAALSGGLAADYGYIVRGTAALLNSKQAIFLSHIDTLGYETARFVTHTIAENGRMLMHEMFFNSPRWAFDPAGFVYTSTIYNRYEIEVYSDNGELLKKIKREYKPLERSDVEQNNLHRSKKGLAGGNAPGELELTDNYRDIEDLFMLNGGRLVVLTSRGAREREASSMGTFDVFMGGETPVARINLIGEGNPLHDLYIFNRDLLFVIVDGLPPQRDCYLESDRDLEYMTIICYDISELASIP